MSRDAFDTLGLQPNFRLSRADLDAQQRKLSRALHPDRYSNATSVERRHALNEAIAVNEAHRELRGPVGRAEVLLRRLGWDGEQAGQVSGEFLMEMMEAREQLAAARNEPAQLAQLQTKYEGFQQESEGQLSARFDDLLQSHANRGISIEELSEALRLTARLRYFARFLEEAAALEDEAL